MCSFWLYEDMCNVLDFTPFLNFEYYVDEFEEELDILINGCIESMNRLENTLRQACSLSDEFYDFQSIKFTISYVLSNRYFLEKDFEDKYVSMTSILKEFFEIILSKEECTVDDYNEKYEEFIFRLDDWEQIFYTQIYKSSKNYDEEWLKQISNILF